MRRCSLGYSIASNGVTLVDHVGRPLTTTYIFRSFSTVNTVNANKSGFVHGGSNKEKMGKAKGNMSGNHKVQNAQIDNLCTKYKLGKKQRDTVHEMITGEGYGYHEVEQLIKEYFNK